MKQSKNKKAIPKVSKIDKITKKIAVLKNTQYPIPSVKTTEKQMSKKQTYVKHAPINKKYWDRVLNVDKTDQTNNKTEQENTQVPSQRKIELSPPIQLSLPLNNQALDHKDFKHGYQKEEQQQLQAHTVHQVNIAKKCEWCNEITCLCDLFDKLIMVKTDANTQVITDEKNQQQIMQNPDQDTNEKQKKIDTSITTTTMPLDNNKVQDNKLQIQNETIVNKKDESYKQAWVYDNETSPKTIRFTCPYIDCCYYHEVLCTQINCKVFRCGFVGNNPLPPHATKENIDSLKSEGKITGGCGRPFEIIDKNVVTCEWK